MEDVESELESRRTQLSGQQKKRDGLQKLVDTYTQCPELGSPEAVDELRASLHECDSTMADLAADIDSLQTRLSGSLPAPPQPQVRVRTRLVERKCC